MIHVVIYNMSTGKIVQTQSMTKPEKLLIAIGESYLQVDSPFNGDRQYVHDGMVVDRPAQETRIDGSMLVGLPVPCVIKTPGTAVVCDDGQYAIPVGAAKVRVESWPYIDFESDLIVEAK